MTNSIRTVPTLSLFLCFILALNSCSKDSVEERVAPTITFTLEVTASAGGTVNIAGGRYNQNAEVVITATPNTDFDFSGWTGDVCLHRADGC